MCTPSTSSNYRYYIVSVVYSYAVHGCVFLLFTWAPLRATLFVMASIICELYLTASWQGTSSLSLVSVQHWFILSHHCWLVFHSFYSCKNGIFWLDFSRSPCLPVVTTSSIFVVQGDGGPAGDYWTLFRSPVCCCVHAITDGKAIF